MRTYRRLKASSGPSLLRDILGVVLRSARVERRLTLRQLSLEANVSLGYLSEVERGEKEVSSEMLASICQALDMPLRQVLALAARAADEPLRGGLEARLS